MTKKLVRVSSLWITCSFSTSSILYPAWAAILITERTQRLKDIEAKQRTTAAEDFLGRVVDEGAFFRHIAILIIQGDPQMDADRRRWTQNGMHETSHRANRSNHSALLYQSISAKRRNTFSVMRETLLSPWLCERQLHQLIEPTENTAPPLGPSKYTMSDRTKGF